MTTPAKVYFRLQQDEDGYPPVAVESVWAQPGANDREYVIDNIPFFASDATLGDTVLVRNEEGCHWFDRLVRPSENSLLRVTFFDRGAAERVSERLTWLGCSVEHFTKYNILAVSVPTDTKLTDVQEYLRLEADAGIIDYEEPILRQ